MRAIKLREKYDTNAVCEQDQFDYWHDAICDSYVKLDCDSTRRGKFKGKIELERLSDLSLSFVSADTQVVDRRQSDISKTSDAFFLLSMQISNTGIVEQAGRHAELRPSDFALYSSISPYKLRFENSFDQLVLQFPRPEFLSRIPNADELTGRRVSGSKGLGHMISNHLLEFSKSISGQTEIVQRYMQDNMLDLAATGLSSLQTSKLELSNAELLLLQRAKFFTLNNLWNPYLDRQMVANSLGISVRHLSSIFTKHNDSIAAYIRNSRLDKIAYELRDIRHSRLTISEIAMKWGMNNLQHFSKIFKDKFGVSPREYRKSNYLG